MNTEMGSPPDREGEGMEIPDEAVYLGLGRTKLEAQNRIKIPLQVNGCPY